jgi:hypothetical protein
MVDATGKFDSSHATYHPESPGVVAQPETQRYFLPNALSGAGIQPPQLGLQGLAVIPGVLRASHGYRVMGWRNGMCDVAFIGTLMEDRPCFFQA